MKDSEWDAEMTEYSTPPQFLKVKRTYNRLHKTTAWLIDKKRNGENCQGLFTNAVEEPEHQTVLDGHNTSSEVQTADDVKAWSVEDSEPSQGSLDSDSTSTSLNASGSSVENELPCSVCEDAAGNEDGSPGRNIVHTTSPGILLKDPMLCAFPTAWKKRVLIRPILPETSPMPRYPLVRKADTLINSPSLLTLPSHGLNHPFLPEGREPLQTLFEDVWVTPESTILKSPRLSCRIANQLTVTHAGIGCQSLDAKIGNKASEDKTLSPKQFVPVKNERKAHARRRTPGRQRVETQAQKSKKKCVNGFIMFCRMNRKVYLRSHPGTPSTTVTKELANLWHVMPKHERRLYCLKAWKFSCQNDRNVRVSVQETEVEVADPSPLHRLLAQRDLFCGVKRKSSHFT